MEMDQICALEGRNAQPTVKPAQHATGETISPRYADPKTTSTNNHLPTCPQTPPLKTHSSDVNYKQMTSSEYVQWYWITTDIMTCVIFGKNARQ